MKDKKKSIKQTQWAYKRGDIYEGLKKIYKANPVGL